MAGAAERRYPRVGFAFHHPPALAFVSPAYVYARRWRSTVKEHYSLDENAMHGSKTINGGQSGKMSGHSALTTDLWPLIPSPNSLRLKYQRVNPWGSSRCRELPAKVLILREGRREFLGGVRFRAAVLCCLAVRDSLGREP